MWYILVHVQYVSQEILSCVYCVLLQHISYCEVKWIYGSWEELQLKVSCAVSNLT